MGWSEFILAFLVFFLSHLIPVRPPVRPWLVGHLGQTGFTAVYSALSVAILGWIIAAAGRAPYVALWDRAAWQTHVPLTAMGIVCLIVALSLGRPNPFSFGGAHNDRFDPAHPGIIRYLRHPLLAALAIWALAHMVPNGDLAHVIVFGVFALFALLGQSLITRRRKRELGPRWQQLNNAVRAAPS
ncbi:MAG: NnrU family protein [Roseovarius pacificus]|nr:NnrU family protein [Roseovarius pacificus]